MIRLRSGTAHALDGRDFPIPVMGKTGTTSDFRDALFVGSTYGPKGITVAVRIGFDDNRVLGDQETGGRAALPIFRETMLWIYRDELVGLAGCVIALTIRCASPRRLSKLAKAEARPGRYRHGPRPPWIRRP